jgi:hypothetical protein
MTGGWSGNWGVLSPSYSFLTLVLPRKSAQDWGKNGRWERRMLETCWEALDKKKKTKPKQSPHVRRTHAQEKSRRQCSSSFAEKHWFLTWAHKLTKAGKAWHLCFHFVSVFALAIFFTVTLQSPSIPKRTKLIISYDNELEPPGATTLPERTIIPRILSNRNQITPSRC